jgi:hypothetical protein
LERREADFPLGEADDKVNGPRPMNAEHILVIDGTQKTSPGLLDRSTLLSAQSLYEFSTIIWVVDALYNELAQQRNQAALEQVLGARMTELQKWVEDGHCLIVINPTAASVAYQHQSGMVVARIEQIFPHRLVSPKFTQGTRVEIGREKTAASAILGPLVPKMTYRTVLSGDKLIPLLFAHRATAGEKSAVGGFCDIGKGRVYFLPFGGGAPNEFELFYCDVARLADCADKSIEVLPQWTSSFRTAHETATLERIGNLNEQRQNIEAMVAAETSKLGEEEGLKHLLSGTGDGFLLAAMTALRELGLLVVEGPNSRADLIASGGGRYFAIEAKGIDGPARERQFRQVERWMAELNLALHADAEHLEDDVEIKAYSTCVTQIALAHYDGSDAKGVLIVGTFRTTALDERRDRDFPDTVERLLTRADTCGMTGVQLFGLVLAVRVDPSLKPIILQEILDTRGVLDRGKDWFQFLSKS